MNHAGHENVVKLLIDSGANVNTAANDGSTPLHTAFQKGNVPNHTPNIC